MIRGPLDLVSFLLLAGLLLVVDADSRPVRGQDVESEVRSVPLGGSGVDAAPGPPAGPRPVGREGPWADPKAEIWKGGGVAQQVDSAPARHLGEVLEVSLVTIGQGDVVWERFGHNAILFRNTETQEEIAYHWGVFNFDQVDFVPRLIRGTMLYSMGPQSFQASVEEYRRLGRPVWVQRLALTPSQRFELLRLVELNYRPGNRDYLYDYYRDNCSTRVRDMLDRILDGRLQDRFAADTTDSTYRWHTRRVLQEMPLYYVGIQWVLGPYADRPITRWEEMFLPRAVMEGLREIDVPDGQGGSRPLVSAEEALFDPGRPGPPTSPPMAFPLFLLVGLLWGGGMVWASTSHSGSQGWARRLGLLLGGTWSLLAGLAGSLILGAWLFTDHFFWYRNANLFQANPLFLALTGGFLLALLRGGLPRWGRDLALVLACVAAVGACLELLPGLRQGNGEILAFTVPLNMALGFSAWRLHEGGGSPSPGGSRGAIQS